MTIKAPVLCWGSEGEGEEEENQTWLCAGASLAASSSSPPQIALFLLRKLLCHYHSV